VELAFDRWRRSSRSEGGANNCVELAHAPSVVAVRDSKNPTGPTLTFEVGALGVLLATVKADRLDG